MSPALTGRFLTTAPPEKPIKNCRSRQKYMLQLASEIVHQIASTVLRFLRNPDLHDYLGFLLEIFSGCGMVRECLNRTKQYHYIKTETGLQG